MATNLAMAEAAQMAEENMDLFRRALLQKAAKRQAAAVQPLNETRPQAPAAAPAVQERKG